MATYFTIDNLIEKVILKPKLLTSVIDKYNFIKNVYQDLNKQYNAHILCGKYFNKGNVVSILVINKLRHYIKVVY